MKSEKKVCERYNEIRYSINSGKVTNENYEEAKSMLKALDWVLE